MSSSCSRRSAGSVPARASARAFFSQMPILWPRWTASSGAFLGEAVRQGDRVRHVRQRPDRLPLPAQRLLPPPAHHRTRQCEHPLRLGPHPHRPPRHPCPPPLRRGHLRDAPYVQRLVGLVGIRAQEPPAVPDTHPGPERYVPHYPYVRPRAPRRARAAAVRHRPGDRPAYPPHRRRSLVCFGGQPGILQLAGRQCPRQHAFLDAAQLGQQPPPSSVEQHIGIGPRSPAHVSGPLAAPLPAGPQRRCFQPVGGGNTADQRGRGLLRQGATQDRLVSARATKIVFAQLCKWAGSRGSGTGRPFLVEVRWPHTACRSSTVPRTCRGWRGRRAAPR